MVFCVSKFKKKWANLRFPLNIQKQKVFRLQGGFAPGPPDQGLCRWKKGKMMLHLYEYYVVFILSLRFEKYELLKKMLVLC